MTDREPLAAALHSGPDGQVRGAKGLVELALEATYGEAMEYVGDPAEGITSVSMRTLGDLVADWFTAAGYSIVPTEDAGLAAAVRRLAETGKVNERMYLTDATYKALAYRIYRGTPPDAALEGRDD